MTSYYILAIWTFVGATGYPPFGNQYDWRYMGRFWSEAACLRAATQLGKKPNQFRCLPTEVNK